MSSLEGAMEALAGLDRLVQRSERGARTAVQIVLSKMQEYAKNNAPFQDRTGNLRNSIQYEMDPGGKPAGVLYAGMNYAIYVELREGYWVLQGAIDYFEPAIKNVFKDNLQVSTDMLQGKFKSWGW
jgi:hypothetical protein